MGDRPKAPPALSTLTLSPSKTAVRPLRVLHCVAGNLYGGVESVVRTLAACRSLAPGMEAGFALCFDGRLAEELRGEGAAVHRLGGVRFSRPWTVWRARRRLARVLRRGGADVLVAHGCWPQMLFGPVARREGRRLVFWMHDMARAPHWIDRRAARVAPDLVLANSHATAATLPRLYPDAPSRVVRYPIPAPTLHRAGARAAVRAELGAGPGEVVIVSACRLERWKGHGLLIEALGRLRDTPGWSAWLAGGVQRPHERAYLDELHAEADAAGVAGRVRFLGQRADVPRLYAAADLHCQPNTGPEPFGVTFVEALYAGLPVVSTDMGGAAEVVTGGCGVLVPPDDPAALADALALLIADPAERARLAAGGPARAAELCDPAAVLPLLEGLFRGVAATRAGAPAGPRAAGLR